MNNTVKNLMIVLGILTVAFVGYYFLMQQSSPLVRSDESEQQLQNMLMRTQAFVGHRQVLDSIELDSSFIQSSTFRNLRSFSPEPQEFQHGRSNPFVAVDSQLPLLQQPTDASEVVELDASDSE